MWHFTRDAGFHRIDLMHNDVKQYFRGSNVDCGSCSHKRIQYGVVFSVAGNLNGSDADMCCDVTGPSSSGSGDLFDFGSSSRSRTFTIFPTTSTAGRHLGFERDYICKLPFVACYVIMHKVYYCGVLNLTSRDVTLMTFTLEQIGVVSLNCTILYLSKRKYCEGTGKIPALGFAVQKYEKCDGKYIFS